jgi:hypothetical protein
MTWVKSFIEKISSYFTQSISEEIFGDDVLCVFLRRGSDYLFLNHAAPKPLVFKTDILTSVEENKGKIYLYLFEEFGISSEKIKVYLESLNLKPLYSKTLSFATVDLTENEFEEMKKHFRVWGLSQISLNSDSNLYFNALTKIVLAG